MKYIKVFGQESEWVSAAREIFELSLVNKEIVHLYRGNIIRFTQMLGTTNKIYLNGKLAYKSSSADTECQIDYLHELTSLSMFTRLSSTITSIDLSEINTSNITNMNAMFTGWNLIKEIDLSNFDVSKVTDLGILFNDCTSLETIKLFKGPTLSLKNMNGVFSGTNLKTIDLSPFYTNNVTDMSSLFASSPLLSQIDVSKFNTDKVTNMEGMFSTCLALTTLDLSSFDTSNVTNMASMFTSCSALTTIDCSSWDTSKVTYSDLMFDECSSLKTIYVKDTTEKAWFEAKITDASLTGVTVTIK
jgi:surface protein